MLDTDPIEPEDQSNESGASQSDCQNRTTRESSQKQSGTEKDRRNSQKSRSRTSHPGPSRSGDGNHYNNETDGADHIIDGTADEDCLDEETTNTSSAHSQFSSFDAFRKSLSWTDMGILITGVILPGLVIGSYALSCNDRIVRLLIKHPVETLIECALVGSIPLINFFTWKAVNTVDARFPFRRGILNGLSIGTALVIAGITAASVALEYPTQDLSTGVSHSGAFLILLAVSSMSLIASVALARQLRALRDFRSSRLRQLIYSITGSVLAVLAFVGSEARSTVVRYAEQMAVSHDDKERLAGLKLLTSLNATRDLIIEGSDPRAAGIPGLFIRIQPECMKPLYFAVTGERYRSENEDNYSVMSGDYLQRHVVGAPIKGLSLLRSSMTGAVHPDTLSSTVNWTYVFSNDNTTPQEARAEIGLPPGAVIAGMSAWVDGKKVEGAFFASDDHTRNGWLGIDHQETAVVTDLGRGRMLMHCYPVAPHSEMKLQLEVVLPMVEHGMERATLTLPRFISSNFNIKGEHQLVLRSDNGTRLEIQDGTSRTLATGQNSLIRSIKDIELQGGGLVVGTSGPVNFAPVAAVNPLMPGDGKVFITQTMEKRHSPAPRNLVVVIDGSKSTAKYLDEIKHALEKLPPSISTSVIVANDSNTVLEPESLKEGLAKLNVSSFFGGQDNLHSVVKAADVAGSDAGGAVLWIHGPQPAYSKEIYLMAPFVAKPKVFEFTLDNGETDLQEFLKNHDEIGPVATVPRTATVMSDLSRFVDHWKNGDVELVTRFTSTDKTPVGTRLVTGDRARELTALWANQEARNLLDSRQTDRAALVAVAHHIVTPTSLLGILRTEHQISQDSSPVMQGATNGTIIMGVNTAGTVRVNNLANLEAMLNLIANSVEIFGLLGGLLLITGSIFSAQAEAPIFGLGTPVGRGHRIAVGTLCLLVGLGTPGIINWLVASCRDANLFA